MFYTYAGVASAVGYPLAMDIFGAWNAVHVVVPLSVPAAVAVGTLVEWANEAWSDDDLLSVGLAVVVLLSGTVLLAVPAYQNVYAEPDSAENDLVQYGQPPMELRPTLTEMESVVAANEGTDVLVYGTQFVGDGQTEYYLPRCLGHSGWFDSLPLPWYYYSMDAELTCAQNGTELREMETLPPVIVTHADNTDAFEDRLDEYELSVHRIRTTNTPVAFFIEKDAAD
jgi:predicted membrane-bound mannosyltransferase